MKAATYWIVALNEVKIIFLRLVIESVVSIDSGRSFNVPDV